MVVLIVLLADLIVLAIPFLIQPLLEPQAFLPFLLSAGEGMLFITLGCFGVYHAVRREAGRNESALLRKCRDLEAEKEQRLVAEKELKQTLSGVEHRLEEHILLSTVIEQTEDNVLVTDCHRTILYINPAFERSCGYTCEELKGRPLRYLRSDQHDKAFFAKMKDVLDHGDIWVGIIINRGKDGIDFEIEGTISPIRDREGAITHWVAVGRNLSRLRKLERELQRAQKMDALGTLAGGIAHDFNNILAAVMGLIEMESIESGKETRTGKRMEQALSACNRARDLIKQILTFSSQGEQRRQPFRIGPVVADALRMLRATLPTTITIQSDFEAADAFILGDSTQVHQIIVNLCTNAAHAMRRIGGILTVGLKEFRIGEGNEEFPDLHPGTYVHLAVKDTGEGMDLAVRERIFEPFFTTKAPGEGAGVGLSVVHGIVKRHGGKIMVQSEPGKGSTFDIFFPKVEGKEADSSAQSVSLPTGSEHILLVDDEELVVMVAHEMLATLGYQVTAEQRGLDALELFRLHPGRFQMVLSDLTMPGMTGIELINELRRIRPGLPAILCTGFSDEKTRKDARDAGVNRIVSKPFVLQELGLAIREVLDRTA